MKKKFLTSKTPFFRWEYSITEQLSQTMSLVPLHNVYPILIVGFFILPPKYNNSFKIIVYIQITIYGLKFIFLSQYNIFI